MKILIVSATYEEIEPTYNKTEILEKKDSFISKHRFMGKEIDILITGIGIASTAYRLGRILGNNTYDYAFNFGIAGAYDKSLKPGDVVNVEHDIISELGAENGTSFLKFDELSINKNNFEKSIWRIESKYEICNPALQKLPRVKGITVNTVHGNKDSVERIRKIFSPDVETMEGEVFLQICNEEKIQCAQVRSISNYVEERNLDNWKIDLAIENLNITAMRILNAL